MLIVAFAALVSAVLVFSLRRPAPSNERSVSNLSATVAHGVSAGNPIVATPELKIPAGPRRTGNLDWASKYYGAYDAFEFVTAAAAYYVAQAVTRCYWRENDPWNTVDSETAFVGKWAKMPNEQFAMQMDRKVMNACLRYVRENAFEGLPERAGGYKDRRFWGKIAYDGGYPLALTDHASDDMSDLPNGPNYETANRQKIARVQIDVERVFASGQPEAIEAYAASYARAQQLAYAVRSGDPSAVQPLIKFREEIHHQ